MISVAEKIESELEKLPVDDLRNLNGRLVQQIYHRPERISATDRDELQARIDSVDKGTANRTDAFEALANAYVEAQKQLLTILHKAWAELEYSVSFYRDAGGEHLADTFRAGALSAI